MLVVSFILMFITCLFSRSYFNDTADTIIDGYYTKKEQEEKQKINDQKSFAMNEQS